MAGATGERPATEKQTQVLAAIDAFRAEHGYPPSVREIGERVGLSSTSTIHAHLKALERRGLISRDPTKPRALRSSSMDQQPIRDSVLLPIVGKVAADGLTDRAWFERSTPTRPKRWRYPNSHSKLSRSDQ